MPDRATFFERYPWLAPHDEHEALIMGDDLDAALATALFLHRHPRAEVIGFYSRYKRVVYAAKRPWADVLGALWLDLDIYHPACRSLGHHIVRLSAEDRLPGFTHSCNLNEVYGRSVQNFRQKYPLGTVHFLMWLYAEEPGRAKHPHADLLIWLADSAYINGQAHRFRHNVGSWLEHALPLPWLTAGFDAIDTERFEARMQEFYAVMERWGFVQGNGQVTSRHLQLSGYQCQPQAPEQHELRKLLIFAAQQTGWNFDPRQMAELGAPLAVKAGVRRTIPVSCIRDAGLDAFLAREAVFSYVFTHRRRLNYTVL